MANIEPPTRIARTVHEQSSLADTELARAVARASIYRRDWGHRLGAESDRKQRSALMAQQKAEQVPRSWTTRRDEKQRRMQLVQPWMKGAILPGAKIIEAL